MSTLEDRYRRLLAVYPAAYRRRYAAEMLTTLMDGADERQRSPRLRESIDLVWNAFLLRLYRNGLLRTSDPRWASASGVFGALAALTLSALLVLKPAGHLGWHHRIGREYPIAGLVPWQAFALAGAWLVVAALAVAGWRKAAAALAWFAAMALAAWNVTSYRYKLDLLLAQWPLIVLALTIAACLTFSRASPSIRQVLGGSLVAFFGAAVVTGSSLWLDSKLAEVAVRPIGRDYIVCLPNAVAGCGSDISYNFGGYYPLMPDPLDTVGAASLWIFLAFGAVMIRVLIKVGGPIRRRLLALAAVPMVTWVVVTNLHHGFSSVSFELLPPASTLTVGLWLVLLLLPLTFAIGVIMVRRQDNRDQLIDLGRAHLNTVTPADSH